MCTSSCQKNRFPNSACQGWIAVDHAGPLGEAGRVVHPAVDRDHHRRAGHARQRDDAAAGDVRAVRDPLPAVHVDRDEDALDEERDPLERERQAEDGAVAPHEAGPQRPELEREDRAGHDADREQRQHHLRPAAGEQREVGILAPPAEPLRVDDQRGEGHAEAHERDVHRERQRLQLSRFEEVRLRRLGRGCEHRAATVPPPAARGRRGPGGGSAAGRVLSRRAAAVRSGRPATRSGGRRRGRRRARGCARRRAP